MVADRFMQLPNCSDVAVFKRLEQFFNHFGNYFYEIVIACKSEAATTISYMWYDSVIAVNGKRFYSAEVDKGGKVLL